MAEEVFQRKVREVDYSIAAEMLASGAASFTFTPPLPGRAPVIHVDEDIVQDILRMAMLQVEYDPEMGAHFLTLPWIGGDEAITDNEEDPGFKTATQCVPNDLALDMVLDWLVEECPNCQRLHYGEDIWPSLPDSGEPLATKKPLLN